MSIISTPKEGMIKPRLTVRQRVRATLGRMRPGWPHLVDALFSAVVVGLVLLGLRTAVFGWPSVVAAGVGILLGLAVGHVQATYRWPILGIGLFTVVMYMLVGALVVVRDDLKWHVLPTLTTLKDLAGAPVHGWRRWLTQVPPVDARGQMVALVLFVALVGTVLVYVTARRHRSAVVVCLPVLGLLAVVLVMGTQAPAARTVHGIVLPLVLLAWFAARTQVAEQRTGRPAVSRVLTGAAILGLAGLAAGLLGPLLGDADPSRRSTLRADITPVHDLSLITSPLGSFRSYTEDSPAGLWDAELFSVEGVPVGAPLRLATLDTWDGTTWGVTGLDATGDPRRAYQLFGRRVGVATTSEEQAREISVEIPDTGGYSGAWVPTTGNVHGITLADSTAERVDGKAWLNLSTDSVLVPAGLEGGDSYTLRTVLTPSLGAELPQSLPVAQGSVRLTADTDFVAGRIEDWAGDETDRWRRLVAVATAMREEGRYTDGIPVPPEDDAEARSQAAEGMLLYPPGHGRSRMTDFLGSTPLAGDDEQYASALALIGNRLGIPTRVVLGAVSTKDGVIRGRDVHAWVEVQLTDRTWYPLMPQTFVPPRDAAAPDAGTRPWQAPDVEPPPAPPAPPPVPVETTDWSSFGDWPVWAKALALLVGIPLVLLLVSPLVAAVRRLLRSRSGRPDQRVGRAWADLVDEARSMGLDVPLRASRPEQAMAMGPEVDAMPLAVGADALVFGEAPPDGTTVGGWLGELRAVRRRTRRAAGLRARLLAAVDPRRILTHDVPATHRPRSTRRPRKADRP